MRRDGIAYSFLGEELGGRPRDSNFYHEGVADYEVMALADEFRHGLARVLEGARLYRIALMCSEHQPSDCHRCLLVGRALKDCGLTIQHILADGTIASQQEIEEQLLAELGLVQTQSDFFASPEERLANAYRSRARKVAFSISASQSPRAATLE